MPEQENSPNMDKAQAVILKKMAEDGLLHTLSWGDALFRQAASAFLEDEIAAVMGSLSSTKKLSQADKDSAKTAATLVVCLPYIRQATTSLSTNQSQNFLRLAMAEAAANALRNSPYLARAKDEAHATLAKLRTDSTSGAVA